MVFPRSLLLPAIPVCLGWSAAIGAPQDQAGTRPDVIVADFEGPDWGDWEADGEAFGDGPFQADERPPNQTELHPVGSGFASSYDTRAVEAGAPADALEGRLTSKLFTLERDYLTFRLGGGNFRDETCVNLLVRGKPVLSATGPQSWPMREEVFDVRPWKGKNARLELVDARGGPWGYVVADHFVLTDLRPDDVSSALSTEETTALRTGIDAAVRRGVEYLIESQQRDGSWAPRPMRYEGHFDQRNDVTALALYTLLRAGTPPGHPSIERGLAYLERGFPRRTYAIGCQLLALEATGDERHEERIEELIEQLHEGQDKGTRCWGYPGHAGLAHDLSNLQYAALGFRASQHAGYDVPKKTWEDLLEAALGHLEEPYEVTPRVARKAGAREIAGFSYSTPVEGSDNPDHHGTGSMTAAGVSVLCLVEEGLGKSLRSRSRKELERARELGLAWLEENYAVDKNPGGTGNWVYYYLYGLERVGSLLGLAELGGRDWYLEGAEWLVKQQRADGSWRYGGKTNWPPAPLSTGNTCFALLFLTKATGAVTGENRSQAAHVYQLEGAQHDVWIRAAGERELTAWVSGFSPSVRSDWAHEGLIEGLRVAGVEWFVDGESVATVAADPQVGWDGERFPMQHVFDAGGAHELQAVVRLLAPGADHDERELRSGVLSVRAGEVLTPWLEAYAAEAATPLGHAGKVEVTASSQLSDEYPPARAIDGYQFSGWVCAADDRDPTLAIALQKGVRASRIVLSPIGASRSESPDFARIHRVEVDVSGVREPFVVDVSDDPLRKTVIELPKARSIKKLTIRILERTESGEHGLATGFAEVELER